MYVLVNSLEKSDKVLQEFLLIKHQSLASSVSSAFRFSKISLLLIWYPLLNLFRSSKKWAGPSSLLFLNFSGQLFITWNGVWVIPKGKCVVVLWWSLSLSLNSELSSVIWLSQSTPERLISLFRIVARRVLSWLKFSPNSSGSLSSVSEFWWTFFLLFLKFTDYLFNISFLLFIFSFSDFPWFLHSFWNELWAVGFAVLFIPLFLFSIPRMNFSRSLITCSSQCLSSSFASAKNRLLSSKKESIGNVSLLSGWGLVAFETSGKSKSIPSQRRDWLEAFGTVLLFCKASTFVCLNPLPRPAERFIILGIAPVLLWVIGCPVGKLTKFTSGFGSPIASSKCKCFKIEVVD